MGLNSLIRSAGVRNFSKLLSANVVAQAIGLLAYPILTRIYTPADFGLLNLFLSIGSVLVVLSLADYYYAIVLPKNEREAVALVHVSAGLLLLTVLLVAISVPFAPLLARLFRSPELSDYYWMMPIFVLVMGGWNILNYWFIRQKAFGRISVYQVSQSALSASGKMAFGYAGILQGGMIYSVVIAPIISLIVSVIRYGAAKLSLLKSISCSAIAQQAKSYCNFPFFVLPRSFINVLAGQLPVLLLTPFFGVEMVGVLSMALLLGYTPIGTITRALYQVLYQYTIERVHASRKIGDMFWRFMRLGTVSIVPIFAGLFFVLPDLVSWLLGEEWRVAGVYIRWMLPWLYVSLLTGSTCYLSDVFMQQKVGLFFEILLALCRVVGLMFGVVTRDFMMAVAGYSIGTAFAVLAQLVWLATLVRRYDNSLVERR